MAQTIDTDALYTRVRNSSGAARTYGYLGTHGRRLLAGEVITVPGDLRSKLVARDSLRKFKALERDLLAGNLAIETTPPPVLFDEVLEVSKLLSLQSGALGIVDPSWDASGSSDFDDG